MYDVSGAGNTRPCSHRSCNQTINLKFETASVYSFQFIPKNAKNVHFNCLVGPLKVSTFGTTRGKEGSKRSSRTNACVNKTKIQAHFFALYRFFLPGLFATLCEKKMITLQPDRQICCLVRKKSLLFLLIRFNCAD